MNAINIIRTALEVLAVLLTAYAVYRVDDIDRILLAAKRDKPDEDKPVQFNARDIFWVEEEICDGTTY